MKHEIYDELPFWSAPFGLSLLDTIRFRKEINVLDIGSGSGFPMIELAERMGRTCQVYGLDSSEAAVEMTTKKISVKGIRNAKAIHGFSEELPFNDNYFGLIVSNNGLNNVRDEKKSLAECFRVGTEKCQMVLTMNLPGTFMEFYNIFEDVLTEEKMFEECSKMKDHITEKRKTSGHWEKQIKDAGFSISGTRNEEFTMTFSDSDAFLNHSLIADFFRPHWEVILPPDQLTRVFDMIREKLNRKAGQQKKLIMSVPFVCFDCEKKR